MLASIYVVYIVSTIIRLLMLWMFWDILDVKCAKFWLFLSRFYKIIIYIKRKHFE